MPNSNSIDSGISEPQVAENRYLPLTGGIALTTVYALTCYVRTNVLHCDYSIYMCELDYKATRDADNNPEIKVSLIT